MAGERTNNALDEALVDPARVARAVTNEAARAAVKVALLVRYEGRVPTSREAFDRLAIDGVTVDAACDAVSSEVRVRVVVDATIPAPAR